MRTKYESELVEMRRKMEAEKQTKAQMQTEIAAMKQEYENKLNALEARAATAKLRHVVHVQNAPECSRVLQSAPE